MFGWFVVTPQTGVEWHPSAAGWSALAIAVECSEHVGSWEGGRANICGAVADHQGGVRTMARRCVGRGRERRRPRNIHGMSSFPAGVVTFRYCSPMRFRSEPHCFESSVEAGMPADTVSHAGCSIPNVGGTGRQLPAA